MLFGSWAKGRARADSDVDVAVFRPWRRLPARRRLERSFGAVVDVVSLESASIRCSPIVEDGVVVHQGCQVLRLPGAPVRSSS
jgi:predicted nucleotidyltransferase